MEYRKGILVKEIRMGDSEDPYLYAAGPIWDWAQTDEGKWVKSKAPNEELFFYCDPDPMTYGFTIRIYAPLTGADLTFYTLKYAGTANAQ
jgi:hypothetical protein